MVHSNSLKTRGQFILISIHSLLCFHIFSYLLINVSFFLPTNLTPLKKRGGTKIMNKELEKLSEKNDKVAICFNSENKQNANLL